MVRNILLAFLLLALLPLNVLARENEVKRIPKVSNSDKYVELESIDKGFWIAGEVTGGYSWRLNNSNLGFTDLTAVGGYRFNEYLKLGVGFGGRYYFNNDAVRNSSLKWSFPLFANVRGNLIASRFRTITPYYSFSIGGAIKDGFMIRPTIGMRIGENRSAMLLALAYMGQNINSYKFNTLGVKYDYQRFISFICVSIGYEF